MARYQAANNLSLSKRNFRIYYDTSGPAKAKIKHNHKQVKFNGWYLADQLLAQSVWSFWWHELEFNRSDPSRRILLVLRRLLRRSICNRLTSLGCLVPWPGSLRVARRHKKENACGEVDSGSILFHRTVLYVYLGRLGFRLFSSFPASMNAWGDVPITQCRMGRGRWAQNLFWQNLEDICTIFCKNNH